MSRGRLVVATTLVAGAYALLAVAQTYPLIWNLSSHLPGLGLGDNVAFVWNLWWMRQAASSPSSDFFVCPVIFAPLGGRLALHTHTALAGWLSATVLSSLSVVTAYNVLLLISLVLNGLAAYALALLITGRVLPSAVAGAMFLLSPSITARLMGHFNFVMAWMMVAACAACVDWWRTPSIGRAVRLGLCLGLTPFVDYYYSVYEVLFIAAYVTIECAVVSVAIEPRVRRRLAVLFACAAALSFAVAAWIGWSDRTVLELGRTVVSIRSPRNALMAAWMLSFCAVLSAWRFRFTLSPRVPVDIRQRVLHLGVAAVLALLVLSPLLRAGWDLWRAGDYVTLSSSLKSSPTGVDVATLFLGPPFHGLAGDRIRDMYDRLQLDFMEASGWLGIANLAIVLWAVARRRTDSDLRTWLALGCAFGLWALGPSLMLLGRNTGLLLPQALAHFVPLVNNARIPSRAMAVVAMCAAAIVAILLSRHSRRPYLAASALLVTTATELIAAPLPLVRIPEPGVYSLVAADGGDGAVLPIPFGVRDGFEETGTLEHDALYQQTVHEHPVVGGFLARLSPRVRPWYASHEPYATLLMLSRGNQSHSRPSCDSVLAGLRAARVSYVVVYHEHVSSELLAFISTRMPLTPLATDPMRTLYRVMQGAEACSGLI